MARDFQQNKENWLQKSLCVSPPTFRMVFKYKMKFIWPFKRTLSCSIQWAKTGIFFSKKIFKNTEYYSFAKDYSQLDTKRSWHGCPRRLHKTMSRKFSEKRFIKSVYKVFVHCKLKQGKNCYFSPWSQTVNFSTKFFTHSFMKPPHNP